VTFGKPWQSGEVPADRKKGTVPSIFKKGRKDDPVNYLLTSPKPGEGHGADPAKSYAKAYGMQGGDKKRSAWLHQEQVLPNQICHFLWWHNSIRGLRLDIRKLVGFFYSEGGEALEQVAQRGGQSLVLGNTQGKAGPGSEQTNLDVDVPVHCSGVGLHDLQGSFQLKRFYDSISQRNLLQYRTTTYNSRMMRFIWDLQQNTGGRGS